MFAWFIAQTLIDVDPQGSMANTDDTLTDLNQFVKMCASAISVSAPHIYLSALPFAPQASRICQSYQQRFPHTISLHDPSLIHWPVCLTSLHGHSERVTSVAFSPDGKHIISGSRDNTIQVCSSETMQASGSPVQVSHNSALAAAFSPDGYQVLAPLCEKSTADDRSPDAQASLTSFTPSLNDGWLQGPGGQLLFWVPPDFRSGFWSQQVLVIGAPQPLPINFASFAHGVSWTQCHDIST